MRQHKYPWPKPGPNMYYDNGPQAAVVFERDGVRLAVAPTGEIGCNTARRRYLVVCVSCGLVLHPATTGPAHYLDAHLDEKHKVTPDGPPTPTEYTATAKALLWKQLQPTSDEEVGELADVLETFYLRGRRDGAAEPAAGPVDDGRPE